MNTTISETLQEFLNELGEQSGARFALEDNGKAQIRYNEEMDIITEVHQELGLIFLHTPVRSLRGVEDRSAAFQQAMETALFGLGTGGCVLGYDRDDDELVLSVSRPADKLDAQDFCNLFGRFAEIAVKLREAIDQPDEHYHFPKTSNGSGAGANTGYFMRV